MADATARWTRIQTLFEQARARPSDERTAWLRAACGNEPEVYDHVAAMLDGAEHEHDLFSGQALDLLPADLLPSEVLSVSGIGSREGERVGPWVLGARLGSGGMGDVYRAVRADGFDQQAALKLVKPGMDSRAVLARFEAERQILARLQHPGIARFLDGGLTEGRRPYFAMEYVEGEPITDYCDRRRLGVDARLQLFADVCEAVRYAHRSLVVHRDLKPSNILAVEHEEDEAPRPVLLDFGIARVLDDDPDDDHGGGLTRTGQRVLTPSYAAPEQIRGEPPTTATDVFALGSLLYRLLSGARPIETEGRTPVQVEQAVLEDEPIAPSTAVTAAAAQQRGTTADALAKQLRGDLDVICRTALRKEPERRYGSAAELLADVQRHLEGLPIEARPATRTYRLRKFVGRHRGAVVVTAAALVALVALTGVYTARLAAERDRAEAEAATSAQTVAFLRGLFEGANPDARQGLDLTAADLLAAGARRIETDLDGQPDVQAAMHRTIGAVYQDLGAYDSAQVHLERALTLHEALGDPVKIATAQTTLGALLRRTSDLKRSIALHRAALEALQTPRNPSVEDIGAVYVSLGAALHDRGDLDEAEEAYRAALRHLEQADAPQKRDNALNNLSGLLHDRGHIEAAVGIGEQLVAAREALHGPMHTSIALALTGLGVAYHDLGRYDEAEAAYRRAVEIDRALLGDAHPDLAADLNNLGIFLDERGEHEEAEAVFEEALAIKRAVYDADHPQIATTLKSLGFLYTSTEQPEEAERHFQEALAIRRVAYGDGHPAIAEVLGGLGRLYGSQSDYDRAAPAYEEVAATLSEVFGADHPHTVYYQMLYADALHRTGRVREAGVQFEATVPVAREALRTDAARAAQVELFYGHHLAAQGRCAEAATALREAEAVYQQLDDLEATAQVAAALGDCEQGAL
ncbi:MAG: serine/threonine-protein kinase [Bacteroidota bacterium]